MARATFAARLLKVRHHRPGSKKNTKMEAMLQIPGYLRPTWCYLPEDFLLEATARRTRGQSTKVEGSIVEITGRMEIQARTKGSGWLHDAEINLDTVLWHTPEGEPDFPPF